MPKKSTQNRKTPAEWLKIESLAVAPATLFIVCVVVVVNS
jgi:hypothetical protein